MKKKIIAFSIVGVLVAALIVAGVWQWDNIVSLVNSVRYSETQISKKLEHNNEKLQKMVDNTEYINIRGGLTPEEEHALASGEITVEDAVNLVRGSTSLEQIRENAAGGSPPDDSSSQTEAPSSSNEKGGGESKEQGGTKTEETDTMTDEVSAIVAELYVVKSEFLAKLNSTGMQAYDEYVARGSDSSQLNAIIESYMPAAGKLETECDQKVASLLTRLEAALKKGGGDLSLVNEIRQYYYNEKSLTKSYYLNKYMN